jgi:hypothetical protein
MLIPSNTERLAELIATRHELLVQMRDLGRLQMEFIGANDFTQLLKVLASKQRVLTALQAAESELKPFRDQDPATRSWRNPEQREHCAQLARRCDSIFREIVEQERHSETQLAACRNEASARLHGVHSSAQARGAYATQSTSARSYLDLSSER